MVQIALRHGAVHLIVGLLAALSQNKTQDTITRTGRLQIWPTFLAHVFGPRFYPTVLAHCSMPRYEYDAVDSLGSHHRGEMVAPSEAALRSSLAEQRLTLIELKVDKLTDATPPKLSRRDCAELIREVAALTDSDDSLVAGLISAADEADSQRTATVMRLMAAYMARGNSFADAVEHVGASLPPEMKGVMSAAAATGRLSEAIVELLVVQTTYRQVWRRLFLNLTYPVAVLLAATIVFSGILLFVIPTFKRMFDDFELRLSPVTEIVLWWGEFGVWYLFSSALVTFGLVITIPVVVGPAASQRLLQAMPLIGPIVAGSNAARWTRILSVLIRYDMPLDRALIATAEGQVDANLREFSLAAAAAIQSGQPLTSIIENSLAVPQLVAPYARWGIEQNDLAAGFREVSTTLRQHAEVRAQGFPLLVGPFIFYFIFFVTSLTVVGLMSPLLSLITSLSG